MGKPKVILRKRIISPVPNPTDNKSVQSIAHPHILGLLVLDKSIKVGGSSGNQLWFTSIFIPAQTQTITSSTTNMVPMMTGLLIWHILSFLIGFSAGKCDTPDCGRQCLGLSCAGACIPPGCFHGCYCTDSCNLFCPNGNCYACCSCAIEDAVGVGDVVAVKFDNSAYIVNKTQVPADSTYFQ